MKKCLIVDDFDENILVASNHLLRFGVEVDVAKNGFIAIFKFLRYRYCFILMDYDMPVINGVSATRKIRFWEKLLRRSKKVPIYAYTSSKAFEREALGYGALYCGRLNKPMSSREFESFLVGLGYE